MFTEFEASRAAFDVLGCTEAEDWHMRTCEKHGRDSSVVLLLLFCFLGGVKGAGLRLRSDLLNTRQAHVCKTRNPSPTKPL